MKTGIKILGLTSLALLAAVLPGSAKADDYCREYTRNVVIGGHTQQAYGTACRGPDGQWRISSEDLDGQPPQQVDNSTIVIHDGPRQIYQPQVVYVDDDYPDYYYRPRYYEPAPVVFGFGYYGGHGYDHGYYHGGYRH